MSPLLRGGWKITIDTWGRNPENGDLVACYLKHRGSVLGIWHRENGECWLKKENPDFDAVHLGDEGEWMLLGCIKNIVDAPIIRTRTHHLAAVPRHDDNE